MVTKQLILLAWLFLYLKDVNRYKNKIAHNSSDSCIYFKSHFCAWFLILDTNGDWGRMMLGEDLYCAHCKMFGTNTGFYPLDTRSTHSPAGQPKTSPLGEKLPLIKSSLCSSLAKCFL